MAVPRSVPARKEQPTPADSRAARLLSRMRAAFADRSEAQIEQDVAAVIHEVRTEKRAKRPGLPTA